MKKQKSVSSCYKVGDILKTKREKAQTPLMVVEVTAHGYKLINSKNVKLNNTFTMTDLQSYGFELTGHIDEIPTPDQITEPEYSIETTPIEEFGSNGVKVGRRSKNEPQTEEPTREDTSGEVPEISFDTKGWEITTDKPSYKAGETARVSFKAGKGQTRFTFIAMVPTETKHTMDAANRSYKWFTYLTGKDMFPFVKGSFDTVTVTGKWDIRIETTDRREGVEAASVSITVD